MVAGWKGRAECAGDDNPAWLGDEMTPECAVACSVCPVRLECVSEALAMSRDSDCGVWGGTTPTQRHLIRERKMLVVDAWRETEMLARATYDYVVSE